MEYTISIQELIERPMIRSDYNEEWLNKMTDYEITQFQNESYQMCLIEGINKQSSDIIHSCTTKFINRDILYKLFKLKNR
jgi:membrane-bound ClpP family serine protease